MQRNSVVWVTWLLGRLTGYLCPAILKHFHPIFTILKDLWSFHTGYLAS